VAAVADSRERGDEFGWLNGLRDVRLESCRQNTRSIFGARLRRRVPQYGHSVMYGLTSDPQLLQMTNRSGPPALTSRL